MILANAALQNNPKPIKLVYNKDKILNSKLKRLELKVLILLIRLITEVTTKITVKVNVLYNNLVL